MRAVENDGQLAAREILDADAEWYPEQFTTVLGHAVRYRRTQASVSVRQLAASAGVSVPGIYALERGDVWTSAGKLQSIAHQLNVNPWHAANPMAYLLDSDLRETYERVCRELLTTQVERSGWSDKQMTLDMKESNNG